MGSWREVAIGELGRVVTGATPRAGDAGAWGDEVDFLTPSDQRAGVRDAGAARRLSAAGARGLASRLIPAGATCVTCIGATTGKTSLTTRPAVTNQQINSVVPDPAIARPAFVYYLLTAHGPRIARVAGGSAAPIINKRQFERLRVSLPPLAEQDRAAAILGALDDKIAANDRAAHAALALAGALFEQALSGQALSGQALSGQALPARGCRLGDIADLRYGKALPAVRRRAGEVPVIGSAGTTGSHDQALVAGPGIIVGRKGTAGSVHWSQCDFFPIDTTFYVVPRTSGGVDRPVPLEVLFFALRQIPLAAMRSDSAVPGLSRAGVLAARVRVPEPASSRAFQRQAAPLLELRAALSAESAHLARVRDALLPGLTLPAL